MKRLVVVLVLLAPFTLSCSYFFKETLNVKEVVAKKEEMDRFDNPAYRFLASKDLAEKRVQVKNVTIKDVIVSGNIDYEFCVLVSVPYEKGTIDCYIYSRELKTVSLLVKGKTKIDVIGDFGRFFTLLDDAYTKIEIINADITILKEK
ncbi:MAG: hypothetical protein EHM32_00420 [Spirochaetales bacterium]|nr:MAG: hypothetical protein EHM32_00420 [Spirochaetales bacterium]